MHFTDLKYLNNWLRYWNTKLTKYGDREIVNPEIIAWEDHCMHWPPRATVNRDGTDGGGEGGGCCPQYELIDRLNPIYQTRNRREDNLTLYCVNCHNTQVWTHRVIAPSARGHDPDGVMSTRLCDVVIVTVNLLCDLWTRVLSVTLLPVLVIVVLANSML